MPKIIPICIVACALFVNCANDRQADRGINFDQLNELSLDLILEIGNNDDYLPGELREILVMKDGSFIVSDQRKGSIDQLSPEGSFIATVAEQGEGPGELPLSFSILDTGDNRFGVWSGQRRQLDFFVQDESGLYYYDESVRAQTAPHQRLDIIGHHSGDHYFALTGKPDWEFMAFDNPDYRDMPVSLVNMSLDIVEGSKHTLQFPNSLFGDPAQFRSRITMNEMAFLGTPPYRYRDRFRILNGGRYMIGQPRANRADFLIYNEDHNVNQHLEVDIVPRNVERDDLDHAFRHLSEREDLNVRRELEGRVDDQKPAFLNFWSSNDHLWLNTDSGQSGNQFVVLDLEGDPVGKFYLEEYEDLQVAEDDRLYVFNRDPEKGHTIRVYHVQF